MIVYNSTKVIFVIYRENIFAIVCLEFYDGLTLTIGSVCWNSRHVEQFYMGFNVCISAYLVYGFVC